MYISKLNNNLRYSLIALFLVFLTACSSSNKPATYTIGGTVTGLLGSGLILQNNEADDLAIDGNGDFTFSTPLTNLSDYSVSVFIAPGAPYQTCVVENGDGTLAGANITNIVVSCSAHAGLSGTFGTTWETLTPPLNPDENMAGLQSFHYSGFQFIYDFTNNLSYNIADDSWATLTSVPDFLGDYWVNGAVSETHIWVPRAGNMYRFSLSTEQWELVASTISDGSAEETAAVFDGEGYIWYHGDSSDLIRYDTTDNTTTSFPHAGFDVFETRVAYDPVTNTIVFTGFQNDHFMIFDIENESFTEGSINPGGEVKDNTCQDRSGGIYAGSTAYDKMYRYDISADTWTVLPDLPTLHDNNSTCVVSQDGWLYYGTFESGSMEFFRLQLGIN